MEYKTLSANSLINAEQLNELAEEGWLLVCIVPVDYQFHFYLCRPKQESWADEAYATLRRHALEQTPDA